MDCYKVWILYELKWLGASVYNDYSKMVIGLMAIWFWGFSYTTKGLLKL